MKRYLAEAIGTFILVFAGTSAIVVDDLTSGGIGHVGIALSFGLAVLVAVYAFGEVSGAHINPAVSIGMWAGKRLPAKELAPYIASQCVGALAASAVLRLCFPAHPGLGITVPSLGMLPAFIYELIATTFLMLVVLAVTRASTAKGHFAGVAIGGTIALDALFAGKVSGASMNPARSLAPAVMTGQFGDLSIYIAAPILGALFAVVLHDAAYGRARGS